jgi:hypothetical protein
MKTALTAVFFLVVSVSTSVVAAAQDQSAVAAAEAACGQTNVEFRVPTTRATLSRNLTPARRWFT